MQVAKPSLPVRPEILFPTFPPPQPPTPENESWAPTPALWKETLVAGQNGVRDGPGSGRQGTGVLRPEFKHSSTAGCLCGLEHIH